MSQPERPLRFGFTCTEPRLQLWQVRCVQQLLALQAVELALVIFDEGQVDRLTVWDRLKTVQKDRLLFTTYRKYLLRPRARRTVNIEAAISNVPAIHCKVIKKGRYSRYFKDEELAVIRAHNLDFILRFAPGIIRGGILTAARYGVWSFHHDDEQKYRGGPPCFWEIYNGDALTGAILQRLTEKLDGGIILKKGFVPTVWDSYPGNIDAAYFESSTWPAQVCLDIRNGKADYLDAPPSSTQAPILYPPTNREFLTFIARVMRNRLAHQRLSVGS